MEMETQLEPLLTNSLQYFVVNDIDIYIIIIAKQNV